MKILKWVALFGGGFIVGGVAVGLWSGYLFSRMTVAKEVEVAYQAGRSSITAMTRMGFGRRGSGAGRCARRGG